MRISSRAGEGYRTPVRRAAGGSWLKRQERIGVPKVFERVLPMAAGGRRGCRIASAGYGKLLFAAKVGELCPAEQGKRTDRTSPSTQAKFARQTLTSYRKLAAGSEYLISCRHSHRLPQATACREGEGIMPG